MFCNSIVTMTRQILTKRTSDILVAQILLLKSNSKIYFPNYRRKLEACYNFTFVETQPKYLTFALEMFLKFHSDWKI